MRGAMSWGDWILRTHAAWRVGGVALIHAILLGWALTAQLTVQRTAPPESIEIEFAEIEIVPEPEPMPEPEPEPTPEPPPPPKPEPAVPTLTLAPDLEPDVTPNPSDTPEILTQNVPAELPTASAPANVDPSPGETDKSSAVTDAEIASVLQQLHCQKLTHRKDEACPDADPFTASASVAARATVERNTEWDYSYRAQTATDKIYEQEVRGRLHWPDRDLFADPMPPGAYDAERIRRGQEPLWSQEMRDGFRKAE